MFKGKENTTIKKKEMNFRRKNSIKQILTIPESS